MAVYKVAQDVEADDKLLGPFTARQFIYLIIVAMAGAMAYFLSRILLPLMLIPMPVILFFGALALPLRKDQPMEVYLAAMISFYLKPRRRLWVPDGIESLVDIVAPRVVEVQRTKDFTQAEAQQRLGYLASIVDTEGWAVRNATGADASGTSMIGDVYNAAQATIDPLDSGGAISQNLDSMIEQADHRRRQELIDRMHSAQAAAPPPTPQVYADPYVAMVPQAATPPTPVPDPVPVLAPALIPVPAAQLQPVAAPAPQPTVADTTSVHFDPYPTIHQSVIQPMSDDDKTTTPAPEPAVPEDKTTSETSLSPDIIKLVNNSDLSIETIAREANRIKEKDEGEEVVISLR